MELVCEKRGTARVIKIMGRMDALTAPAFETECEACIDQGDRFLIMDLAELEYISSAGLRSILQIAKKLKSRQGQICFCSLSQNIMHVFTISGFTTLFQIYDSVEEALNEL